MKKEPKIFIEHILECIELIEEYRKGKARKDFLEDLPGLTGIALGGEPKLLLKSLYFNCSKSIDLCKK